MALLYHFWQYRAYFSVRYCPNVIFILLSLIYSSAINRRAIFFL